MHRTGQSRPDTGRPTDQAAGAAVGSAALGVMLGLTLGRLWSGAGAAARPGRQPTQAAGAEPSVRVFQVQQGPEGPVYIDTGGAVVATSDASPAAANAAGSLFPAFTSAAPSSASSFSTAAPSAPALFASGVNVFPGEPPAVLPLPGSAPAQPAPAAQPGLGGRALPAARSAQPAPAAQPGLGGRALPAARSAQPSTPPAAEADQPGTPPFFRL